MITTLERTETRALDEIVYRDDLYPRDDNKPELARRYVECLEMLPPIKVNQHNELIDGYHRWTAHRIAKAARIAVEVVETTSDHHALMLANEFNSTHGEQLSRDEKKRNAIKLYTGTNKKELAQRFSVTERTVASWLEDIDRAQKEEQRRRIRDLWLSCHTQAEIAEAVDMPKRTVADAIEECAKLEAFPKSHILASRFDDLDWRPKLYSVWEFEHPSEPKREIIDQLLYLYTEPFDIVVDPTDQAGETIDVCKRRLRRYYASDTRPVVERPDVRTLDIGDGPLPLHKRWRTCTTTSPRRSARPPATCERLPRRCEPARTSRAWSTFRSASRLTVLTVPSA